MNRSGLSEQRFAMLSLSVGRGSVRSIRGMGKSIKALTLHGCHRLSNDLLSRVRVLDLRAVSVGARDEA